MILVGFQFLNLAYISVQDAFNVFIFFVLLDKIQLEVTVANFRNIFHPITPNLDMYISMFRSAGVQQE